MEIVDLIEEVDYTTLKNEIVTYIQTTFNGDITFIESDSFSLIVEAMIYRELKIRAKINQALKDAFALINTDDTNNTAGSMMAYKRAILECIPNILDMTITSPDAGVVKVIYHNVVDVTDSLMEYLHRDDIRPLTDSVVVVKATIVEIEVPLSVTVLSGSDVSLIESQIRESFNQIIFLIGENLTLSRVIATAFKNGVYAINSPFVTTNILDSQVINPNISFVFEELV